MKKIHIKEKIVLFILLAAMLVPAFAACGNNDKTPNTSFSASTADPQATSGTLPPSTRPPQITDEVTTGPKPPVTDKPITEPPVYLEKIEYAPVEGRDDLWDICFEDGGFTEETYFSGAVIKGDMLLISVCSYGEGEDEDGDYYFYENRTVYLIDLVNKGVVGKYEPEGDISIHDTGFLDDGSVYMLSFSDGDYEYIDLLRFENFPKGKQSHERFKWDDYLGLSGDGIVWLFNSDERVLRGLTPFDDRPDYSFARPGWISANYYCRSGNSAFFGGYSDTWRRTFVEIDLSNGSETEYPHLKKVTWENEGFLQINSYDDWMTVFPDDLYTVNVFPQGSGINSIHATAGRYFTAYNYDSDEYDWDEDSDEDVYIFCSFGVYDAKTGRELGRIFESEELMGLAAVCMDDKGTLILSYYGEKGDRRLLLWKYNEGKPTENKDFRTIDARGTGAESRRLAQEIYDRYGIRVFYDELSLIDLVWDYTCEYIDDEITIVRALEELSRSLAKYPAGIFDEMLTNNYDAIEIYLCGYFTPTGDTGISNAAAITSTNNGALIMAFCVHYLDMMEQNLSHELMHVMERRIAEYCDEKGIPFLSEWDALNPKGFNYYNSYHDENGYEIYDTKYTTWQDPEGAWFVDPYSKSFAVEDRARIFENLFAGNEYVFQSPHMRVKAEYLCYIIRTVFPSVRGLDRASWEMFAPESASLAA